MSDRDPGEGLPEQLCLLAIAVVSIVVELDSTLAALYWFRVTFVVGFVLAELLQMLLVANDYVLRRRLLAEYAHRHREE